MRDRWYGDKRDLVKWAVLFQIAEVYNAKRILQIAYLNSTEYPSIRVSEFNLPVPMGVIDHFRNIRNAETIKGSAEVSVFDEPFEERESYHRKVLECIASLPGDRCVVFLDPDTGLQPKYPSMKHVLDQEAGEIWNALKPGEIFVFYQHQTTTSGKPWVEGKREQLAKALDVSREKLLIAEGFQIAGDVVFLFLQKN